MTTLQKQHLTCVEDLVSEIRQRTLDYHLQQVAKETVKEAIRHLEHYPKELEFFFTLNEYLEKMEINLSKKQRSLVGRAINSWVQLSTAEMPRKDSKGRTIYSSRYLKLFKPAIRKVLGL